MKTCYKCGNAYTDEGGLFCPFCGEALGTSDANQGGDFADATVPVPSPEPFATSGSGVMSTAVEMPVDPQEPVMSQSEVTPLGGAMPQGDVSPFSDTIPPQDTMPPENTIQQTPTPKKPFYKRAVFWIIGGVVFLLLLCVLIGSCTGAGTASSGNESTSSSQNTTTSKSELMNISASYSGATTEGTVLSTTNKGIKVTATYSNGSTKDVTGWRVTAPATLAAGQTSTITIEHEGKTFDLSVACTSMTPDAYKAQCENYSYEELARNPESYKGKSVCMTGEVIQVLEDGSTLNLRINVTEGTYTWSDTVMVVYTYKTGESRLLDDDIVTFYGLSGGTHTYTSVMGAEITVPIVYAQYIDLN